MKERLSFKLKVPGSMYAAVHLPPSYMPSKPRLSMAPLIIPKDISCQTGLNQDTTAYTFLYGQAGL